MIRLEKRVAHLVLRPAVGEVFEMTIDGGAPWNNPVAMLRADGYAPDWQFVGREITGVQTRRFKLETVQGCSNLKEILEVLAGKGKAPEGQWRVPFSEKYKLNNLGEQLGVSDASWINEYGEAHFPFLTNLQSGFHWAEDIRRGGKGWLWLIEIE